jgi:hypothetical protein
MRAAFHLLLPNGPIGDPAVWVDLIDEGQALLFGGPVVTLPAGPEVG